MFNYLRERERERERQKSLGDWKQIHRPNDEFPSALQQILLEYLNKEV
jgi:hypothetical protein